MSDEIRKVVCMDVMGTSFGFSEMIDVVQDVYGDPLKQAGISSTAFVMGWYYCAQRDFAFLSMMNSYTSIATIFKSILVRQLLTAFESLSPTPKLEEADMTKLLGCLKTLPARKHLVECIQHLKENGFEVFAMTNGGKENTQGLYKSAQPDNLKSAENFLGDLDTQVVSCDEIQIAKPNLAVYEYIRKRTKVNDNPGSAAIFIAAHSWDLAGAKKIGFKTAYVDFEEHDAAEEVFGKPDYWSDDLLDLAKKIVDGTV